MREDRIVVYPFEDLQVLDYHALQQVNEHAKAEIKGRIPFDKRVEYVNIGRELVWVKVMAISSEDNNILFYGILEHLRVEVKNSICMISISLSSGTLLMDLEEHVRSFQSREFTYKDLLDVCSAEYDNSAQIMMTGKNKQIPHFIMQYRETDWSFIKRLATMNQTVVFADCLTKGEKYHFGIPDRGSEASEFSDYQIQYDMEEFWNKKKSGLTIHLEDEISYVWESREIHKLGECKIVEGKSLVIWKIETYIKGNELYHICFMKPCLGLQSIMLQNSCLSGVSLLGEVKSVMQDRVQVIIHCDEYKNTEKLCWFLFSSIYSSGDGTGWYCMPEVGDIVRIYFPTDKEEDAYVASAYHEKGTELRTNPECKFWRNKEGKEIQLSPERILLTNNNGTYIELSDKDGLQMVSDGSITIYAHESLRILAGLDVELSARNEVILKQDDTRMNLGGNIVMQGAKVML